MTDIDKSPPAPPSVTLLPCPFCGSEQIAIVPQAEWWAIICKACGSGSGTCDTEAEAITAWNTRTSAEAASAARVEALVEALRWYADTFCEGFGECVGDTCGKWRDDQCSGCKAHATLTKHQQGEVA